MPIPISLKLVREVYPKMPVEALVDSTELILKAQGIDEIDNMELFDRVEKLDLSHNGIRRVENLEWLSRLTELDLSFNKISVDGLNVSSFPSSSLKYVNLSGNPCCADLAAMHELRAALPFTTIEAGSVAPDLQSVEESGSLITPRGRTPRSRPQSASSAVEPEGEMEIEIYGERPESSSSSRPSTGTTRDRGADEYDDYIEPYIVLDSDKVLQDIVERKMMIENHKSAVFDVNNAATQLDTELAALLEQRRSSRSKNNYKHKLTVKQERKQEQERERKIKVKASEDKRSGVDFAENLRELQEVRLKEKSNYDRSQENFLKKMRNKVSSSLSNKRKEVQDMMAANEEARMELAEALRKIGTRSRLLSRPNSGSASALASARDEKGKTRQTQENEAKDTDQKK